MNGAHYNSDSDEEFMQDALSNFSNPLSSAQSFMSSQDGNEVVVIQQTSASSNNATSNRLPLIPSDCDNVHEAMENFVRVFESRYGEPHPFFTPVSFQELINEVQSAHHSVRKPALIYIHDDNSITTQVFCTQVLCAPAMVDFINSNFIMWGWDFTLAENRTKLIDWIETSMGHQKSLRLRVCTTDEFPVLLVLSKENGTVDIVDMVRGNFNLESILCHLMTTLDSCHAQLRLEAAEEVKRRARERVRSEQEAAFQESLEADKLKHQLKIEEERKKEQEIAQQQSDEAAREEERKRVERNLAPEPLDDCQLPVTRIRIRLPSGENVERRFLMQQPIQHLFDFMTTKNLRTSDYKVFGQFPKRELTAMSPSTTFDLLKFSPREVVVIESI